MISKRNWWKPEELFPRVNLLRHNLEQEEHITGVALTGSLARREKKVYDIDLIVFHDGTGSLRDGRYQNLRIIKKGLFGHKGKSELNEYSSIPLSNLDNKKLERTLAEISFGVSVDYILVGEQVLWDCKYLQSLRKHEGFPEFYQRIFCALPLYLLTLEPAGELFNHMNGANPWLLATTEVDTYHTLSYWGIPAKHICQHTNSMCAPTIPWKQVANGMDRRKKRMGLR